jgi:hypothetical protein
MTCLEQYAKMHGEGLPMQAPPPTASYEDRRATKETVDRLKADILLELERGEEPESILFDCLNALGLATNDRDYAEKACSFLNGDKAELSFFLDLEEMQQKRDERRAKYYDKRRKEVTRQLKQLESDRGQLEKELEQIRQDTFADRYNANIAE